MALADIGVPYPASDEKSQRAPRWTSVRPPVALPWRRLPIAYKTLFWLIIQTLIVVAAFSFSVNWAFDKGFTEYMSQFNDTRAQEMAHLVGAEYAKAGSWNVLRRSPRRWAELAMMATGHPVGARPDDAAKLEDLFAEFHEGDFPQMAPAPLPLRFVLLSPEGQVLIGNPRAHPEFKTKEPVTYRNRLVGYLAISEDPISTYDLRFRQRFYTALFGIIVGSILLAVVPAFFIARLVTRPVEAIGRAARSLADGQTEVRLPITSNDELGDLCRDFNGLSASLAKHETLQRLWLAELSHELRTPVAILMAETEAMLDGVRPLDLKRVQSLNDESRRLSRLIGDLHQLCLSDFGAIRYVFSNVKPAQLVEACIEGMASQFEARDIAVALDAPPTGGRLRADPDKLRQVFRNLLENSLRYTDAGGRVLVTVAQREGGLSVAFDDSSPSVPEHEIGHLFERLYRGESSRSRKSGGSGLGLAIVRTIVEAHGGVISASPSPLGGLRFEMLFKGDAQ